MFTAKSFWFSDEITDDFFICLCRVVPSCWNEVLIHLTIWSVLHSQNQDVTKASNWLKKKVQVAKEYPFVSFIFVFLKKFYQQSKLYPPLSHHTVLITNA